MVTSTGAYVLRVNFITHTYFFQNIQSFYYALASTCKDFMRGLMSETSIFRLDLSAATIIYVKKGLADTSFVITVIWVFMFQIIFHGDCADKVKPAFNF